MRIAFVVAIIIVLLLAYAISCAGAAAGAGATKYGGKPPAKRKNKPTPKMDDGFAVVGKVSLPRRAEIINAGNFNWFGATDADPSEAIREWCKFHVNADITRSVQEIVNVAAAPAVWVSIRVTAPSDEYDTPVWRYGRESFVVGPDKQHKYVASLAGPSVMVMRPSDAAKKLLADAVDIEKSSVALAQMLAKERVVQPAPGQVVKLQMGFGGALHSEPPLDVARIIVSVAEGTPDQIRDLAARQSLPYVERHVPRKK